MKRTAIAPVTVVALTGVAKADAMEDAMGQVYKKLCPMDLPKGAKAMLSSTTPYGKKVLKKYLPLALEKAGARAERSVPPSGARSPRASCLRTRGNENVQEARNHGYATPQRSKFGPSRDIRGPPPSDIASNGLEYGVRLCLNFGAQLRRHPTTFKTEVESLMGPPLLLSDRF